MYNGKTATCITITKLWIFVAMKLLESRIFIVCCQLSPRTTDARDVRTQTFWRPRPRLSNDRRPRRRRRRYPVLLVSTVISSHATPPTRHSLTLPNTTHILVKSISFYRVQLHDVVMWTLCNFFVPPCTNAPTDCQILINSSRFEQTFLDCNTTVSLTQLSYCADKSQRRCDWYRPTASLRLEKNDTPM